MMIKKRVKTGRLILIEMFMLIILLLIISYIITLMCIECFHKVTKNVSFHRSPFETCFFAIPFRNEEFFEYLSNVFLFFKLKKYI